MCTNVHKYAQICNKNAINTQDNKLVQFCENMQEIYKNMHVYAEYPIKNLYAVYAESLQIYASPILLMEPEPIND